MTPLEQNMTIATSLGWKFDWSDNWQERRITYPDGYKTRPTDPRLCLESFVPNYLDSLDDMHEVEKTLTFTGRQRFYVELQRIISRPLNGPLVMFKECISATAAERAEAYLKALNLWK